MNSHPENNRQIESLIRLGTIAEVDHAAALCRVNSGALRTDWLKWFALRAGTTRVWSPPTVGEQCVVLSPSGEVASGIVLLGIFSDSIPAPSGDKDLWLIDLPDGAQISYNHASSAMVIAGIKTGLIRAAEKLTFDCPESEFTGNVTIKGKATVFGDLLAKAKAMIQGAFSYESGMSGKGKADIKDGLSIDGIEFGNHRHKEFDGGGDTGEPRNG